MSDYDRTHHLVIGAGLVGVIAGYTYSKAGVPVVLFEREDQVGGVWNNKLECSRVNSESRAQIEPTLFRAMGDYTPVEENTGNFGGIWSTPQKVVEQIRDLQESQKLKICFKREVLKWEIATNSSSGEVVVTWKDLITGEVKSENFAGLHIRAGFQHKPKKISFHNQNLFRGIRSFGINDDVSLESFKGKQVVVFGAGSSAVDNAQRAMIAGASQVTIVYRNVPRILFTSFASYLLMGMLSTEALINPEFLTIAYRKVFAALKKGWEYTGNDFLNDCEFFVDVQGEKHFRAKHGVDAFRCDSVLLGAKYGLIKFVKDEIESLGEHEVYLKNMGSVQCDVLIQCAGYQEDLSLVKGHTMNGIFIDGRSNLTQFVAVDRVVGTKLYGPKNPEMMIYAPNAFNIEGFDKIAIYYQKNPELFAQYFASPIFSSIVDCENYDGFETNKTMQKVLFSGHDDAVKIIYELLAERQAMREKLLPTKKFLELNKAEWDKLSELLAQRTGKPVVSYPYEAELNEAYSRLLQR